MNVSDNSPSLKVTVPYQYRIENEPKKDCSYKYSLIPNNTTLFDLKIGRKEFVNILNFVNQVPQLCRPLVFKKNETGLPFSIACVQEADKISTVILFKKHRLPLIAEGTYSAVTLAWNIESGVKEVFKSASKEYVSDTEIAINKLLSGREEFATTSKIFEYEGPVSDREPFEASKNILLTRSLKQEWLPNDHSKKVQGKAIVPKVGFILEYLSCSLVSYLKNRKIFLRQLLLILRGILKNIAVLHNEFKIAHCDIKLDNVLVQDASKKEIVTKLADFGLANYIGEVRTLYLPSDEAEQRDAAYYLPPEIISSCDPLTGKIYYKADAAKDIWSFGIMLVGLIGGIEGIQVCNDLVAGMFKMKSSSPEVGENMISHFFRKLQSIMFQKGLSTGSSNNLTLVLPLIRCCLKIDPAERITAEDAITKLDEVISYFDKGT